MDKCIPVISSKKTPKKQHKKASIFLCSVLVLIFFVYGVLTWFINPVVISISESKVKSTANTVLNDTVYKLLTTESYDDLVITRLDSNGKLALIQTNGIKLNLLAQTLLSNSKKTLNNVDDNQIQIPIGDLTRIPLLSGRGPNVTVKLRYIGSMSCSIYSEFEEAGINQTKHSLIVNFSCSVNLVIPGNIKKFPVTVSLLLSEAVIIGDIPSTYLSGDNKPLVSVKD